jgi:small subunit ribosomal protein S17
MDKVHKQEKVGVVSSAKMDKTIVVNVRNTFLHPMYKRVVRKTSSFKAHDEKNECGVGDVVRIVECRPLSKTKRWRLSEIVEKAK